MRPATVTLPESTVPLSCGRLDERCRSGYTSAPPIEASLRPSRPIAAGFQYSAPRASSGVAVEDVASHPEIDRDGARLAMGGRF